MNASDHRTQTVHRVDSLRIWSAAQVNACNATLRVQVAPDLIPPSALNASQIDTLSETNASFAILHVGRAMDLRAQTVRVVVQAVISAKALVSPATSLAIHAMAHLQKNAPNAEQEITFRVEFASRAMRHASVAAGQDLPIAPRVARVSMSQKASVSIVIRAVLPAPAHWRPTALRVKHMDSIFLKPLSAWSAMQDAMHATGRQAMTVSIVCQPNS